MASYHLRNYEIVAHHFDYVGSVRKNFELLIEKLLSVPPSLAPLNDDNEKTATLTQGFADAALDLDNLQLTLNASSFGAFDCARRLVSKNKQYLASWTPLRSVRGNTNATTSPVGEIQYPQCATPQRGVYKLVSAGLHCLANLLEELNEKDSQLCCTALNSLFTMLNSLPVEDLSAEPKSMVDSLFQILMLLRRSSNEDVASLASACALSLAVAYGSTDLVVECGANFVASIWQPNTETVCTRLNITIPDNYLALYKRVQSLAFTGSSNSWNRVVLNQANVLCKFALPKVSNLKSSMFDNGQLYAAVASDGKFIYVLSQDGLTKIGSGFSETRAGQVYAMNAQLKATSDSWLAVCTGSLYLRRKHSTRLSVLDNDTLIEVGEILLPAMVAQGIMCTDGHTFTLITIDDVSNTMLINFLNDSFVLQEGEDIKISLAEAKLLSFGDHSTIDINELTGSLDSSVLQDIVELQVAKSVSVHLTKDGKLFFAGKGGLFGMQDNFLKWQEVLVQERLNSISLSQDGQNLVVVGKSGYVYVFGAYPNEKSTAFAKSKNVAGFPKKLQTPNSRKAMLASCNNGIIAIITENGKLFSFGRNTGLCNPETRQYFGLEHEQILQVAMGKTHHVVITCQGHVYTFGANNLGQCGRADFSTLPDSDSEKSRTDEESSEVTINLAASSAFAQPQPTLGSGRLCAPSAHIWKKEMATICTACGYCSSRGHECAFSKNRPKGSLCGCGVGLAGCYKCGICRLCGKQCAASGSEIDTESDGQPYPVATPSRLIFKPGSDYVIAEASCGTYHTILRTVDGLVITFGSNRNGQLGVGETKTRVGPQFVSMPQGVCASQVAAGANHCVVLCKDGTVYSFGKHHNGQLGRDGRQKFWFAQPGLVDGFASDSKKCATWISAGGDVTVIKYSHSLFTTKSVNNGCVIANQLQFIVIPKSLKIVQQNFYSLSRSSESLKKGILQVGRLLQDSNHCYWCLDPLYDTMWCFKADKSELVCFTPFAKASHDKTPNTDFVTNPEFWLPIMKHSSIADRHLGLNLLMSFYILLNEKLSVNEIEIQNDDETNEAATKECFKVVSRFQSYGGGWGYSLQSVEAIQFCSNHDISVAGFGLFGGRGEYLAKLKLLKILNDDGDDRHAETLTETDELIYECGVREHAPLLFPKPVSVKAGEWHVAWVAINGPSSDCGASGMQSITTEDGVTFCFRNSRISNNGTDVHVGQIPVILFKVLKFEDASKNVPDDSSISWLLNASLSSRFFYCITPTCFTALLKVVKLAIETTIFAEFNKRGSQSLWDIECAASCVILSLRILKFFVLILYPSSKQPVIEHKEFIPYIENMFQIIVAIMDSIKAEYVKNYPTIEFLLHECTEVITACFNVFFPVPALSAHFLQGMMKSDRRNDWTLKAFISSLNASESLLPLFASSSSQSTETSFPVLVAVVRKGRKAPATTTLDFANVLQFFIEIAFESGHNDQCSLRTGSSDFLLKLVDELVSIRNDNDHANNSPAVLQTPKRFTRLSSAMTWDTSSGSPDAISFQVDKSGVSIHGAGIYVGYGCFTYTLELMAHQGDNLGEKWNIFEKTSGVVDPRDFVNDMALIKFAKPVRLDANRVYTLRLYIQGSRTWSGEAGLHVVNGQHSVKFSFSPCSLSLNGTSVTRGQLPIILYSIAEKNFNDYISAQTASKWILLFVKHFVTKMHLLMQQNWSLIVESVFNFAPQLFGHLSIFVENNPNLALDLLASFDELLLSVSCCNGERRSQLDLTPGFRTVSTMVESEHPYKPVKVYSFTVKFNSDISYTSIEFDTRCSTVQPEDSLQLFIQTNSSGVYHPVAKFWGSTNWPKKVLLLPGNTLLLTMETATNYNKVESSEMFGFKCIIIGYEASIVDNLLWFELELVNFCSTACQILIQKSYKLAALPSVTSEADVRSLEDEVIEVLRDHASLLHKGLHLSHIPTVHEIAATKLPLNVSCPEMRFIRDFINTSASTAGGKLARWFMAEPYIDPYFCELHLDVEDLCSGKPVLITIVSKDQYGRIAYNGNVNLEICVSSLQSALSESNQPSTSLGLPQSTQIDIQYQPTYLNKARYLSITMMKSLQAYSFEELHLFHLRDSLLKDILPVVSHQDGTYTASWIPKQSGMYKIECRMDSFTIDQVHTVEVRNGQVVKKVPATKVAHAPRARMATCHNDQTKGVRIRSAASLQAPQIGIIPPAASIFYIDEAENSDGIWLRLSDEAALAFCPKLSNPSSAWCLEFHNHLNKYLLFKDSDGMSNRENQIGMFSQSIIVACDELYIVCQAETSVGAPIRSQPTKSAKIAGYIGLSDVIQSTGWLQNCEGIWIQVDKNAGNKYGSTSSSSASGSGIEGYCFVQDSTGNNIYLERILSPQASASTSLISHQQLSESMKNGNHGEISLPKQVSTQTSPDEKNRQGTSKSMMAAGTVWSKKDLHSRLKPTVKVPPQNSTKKCHVIPALEPTVADCIRSVFAAVLWHEHLVHDAMACAAYLKFHPELHRLQFRNEISHSAQMSCEFSDFNVPISLQMLFNLWKEIFLAVQNVVQKHLILPSPPMTLKTPSVERKQSFTTTQLQLCELCEGLFPSPVTTHMRLMHPGCGRHAGGQGYNSLGKCTGGWTGNCGDGGTPAFTWYLLCQKCRTQYLLKTETQRQKVRKMRARAFRISSGNAEPQRILKNNAMFLLELNPSDQTEQNSDRQLNATYETSKSKAQSAGNWYIDLFPQNPLSFAQSLHGSSSSSKTVRKSSKSVANPLAELLPLNDMTAFASDPGPKRSKTDDDVSLPSSEPSSAQLQDNRRTRLSSIVAPTESQLLLASPSNALKAATRSDMGVMSIHNTCRRPVIAFVIQHHNLTHLNNVMHLAVTQAVLFDRTFQVFNWLLRNTTNPISIIDILWHFITALSAMNSQSGSRILAHPLKLAFLAGSITSQMTKKFHNLLLSVASILRNYDQVSLETLRCCFRAWMFNFTSHDQELVLKSQILSTVSKIVSERNDDIQSTIASMNESITEVEEYEDLTGSTKVEVSSRAAMVNSLIDGSTETFWESGDEDRGRAKSIVVRWTEQTIKPLLLSVFIDNSQDATYRISHITFSSLSANASRQKIKSNSVDAQFTGWIKCLLNPHYSIVSVEIKGPENSVRVRQVQVCGQVKSVYKAQQAVVKHSPSMVMQFNSVQTDAFELFQLIASYAFGEDSTQDGALQQQVLNILFSRSQLHSLQSYVSSQIILSLEREISLLKDKIKRNYSYCCGLLAMLSQISATRYGKNCISARGNATLISLSELLLFSSPIVQCQVLEVFEKIIQFFEPKQFDAPLFIENLLFIVAKSISLQLRFKQADGSRTVTAGNCLIGDNSTCWHLNKNTTVEIAQSLIKYMIRVAIGEQGREWSLIVQTTVANYLTALSTNPLDYRDPDMCVKLKAFWFCVASLCIIQNEDWLLSSPSWRLIVAKRRETTTFCDNHEDGCTIATVYCEQCLMHLCPECSSVLHLNRQNRNHQLQQLMNADTRLQVTINETCSRLRLSWFVIVIDNATLNGLADFRKDSKNDLTGGGGIAKKCRFCGANDASELTEVCSRNDCVELASIACNKILQCGHLCGGIAKEITCLPCLRCHSDPTLRQDADDMCVICFTDTLSAAPSIKLQCNHVFHHNCCIATLTRRWPGPRITFGFMQCPICKDPMFHDSLCDILNPLLELKDDVQKKARIRLSYDGLSKVFAESKAAKKEDIDTFATNRYAYYPCFKCGKAYFGGEAVCQVLNSADYNPAELLCGACSNVAQAQVCPRHGTEYLEYKCRYCCSIAVFFCFGTTHFCAACHDDFQRLTLIPKHQLPTCPVGPKATQSDAGPCPLKIEHPPTGEEFALGCGVCRNLSTF